jgi:predicted HAD superfamily Cof-like phosphohydrolase
MTFFDDVKLFHQTFRLPVGDRPEFTSAMDQSLRMRLINEEMRELRLAHMRGDIVECADAIGDLIYVLCGMGVSYGIPMNEVWNAIQTANMRKLGDDGQPIYREDGKVAKPPGWEPPDIRAVLGV